jgi:hypothetical protein
MTRRTTHLATLAALALLCTSACADTIVWPRLGYPSVNVPGGLLEVGTDTEGSLVLEQAGQLTPLDAQWSAVPAGMHFGRAVLPATISPGRYTLQLTGPNGTTSRPGAVHILEKVPEDYAIAVVRSVASPEGAIPAGDLNAALSGASVNLAVLVGPFATQGAAQEMESLEAQLLALDMPVFLCPRSSDLRVPVFIEHFGNAFHGVTFGRDGYLFLGAGLFAQDPQTHGRLGEAHRLRRALRASRWSVGVAGDYGLGWDLRSQMALFVDDPLNALITATAPPEVGATVPWGKTALILPPPAPQGPITILDVSANGIRPRLQPELAVETPKPQEAAPQG